MSAEGNVIKLSIYGTEYAIKGDTDVDYIKRVASYVDKKMYEVDRSTSADSSLKVAILAALNIADELFRERSENDNLQQQFDDKISQLTKLIERIDKDVDLNLSS